MVRRPWIGYASRAMPDALLGIGGFLPLSKMAELARRASAQYAAARPFPHVVFDDFFNPALLDKVLAEFPRAGAIDWQRFDNAQEIKLASAAEDRKSTRLNSSHMSISYAVFCLKKKKK